MNLHWSYWEKETFSGPWQFVVIGAGIVGMSTALELRTRFPKASIAIVERGSLPSGASSRNAGFACFGSPGELEEDLQIMPIEKILELVSLRWQGLQILVNRLGAEVIDFQALGGHEIFTPAEGDVYEHLLNRLSFWNEQLHPITGLKETYSNVSNKDKFVGMKGILGMLSIQGEGQINTGKMIQALWNHCLQNNIRFFNGLSVERIEQDSPNHRIWVSGSNSIIAETIIVCTNGFARQLFPELPVNPARAQVWVTEEIPQLQIQGTYHYQSGYYYFRNIGNRILVGGGRNLDLFGEETWEEGSSEIIQNGIKALLENTILPGYSTPPAYQWSGTMGVGKDKFPLIQKHAERIWIAVRMGGMGVALGSAVGREIAKKIEAEIG